MSGWNANVSDVQEGYLMTTWWWIAAFLASKLIVWMVLKKMYRDYSKHPTVKRWMLP